MLVAVSIEKKSKFITMVNHTFGETTDIHRAMKISEDEDSLKVDYLLQKIRELKPEKNWALVRVSSVMFGTGYATPTDLGYLTTSKILAERGI